MIVEFDKSFEKSIDKLGDKSLFPKIEEAISILEGIDSSFGPQNRKLKVIPCTAICDTLYENLCYTVQQLHIPGFQFSVG